MIAQQLSIFDIISEASETPTVAVSMFDNQEHELHPIKPWMSNLLPQGEYYILCAALPLVLCATNEKVPPEMRYRHFTIGEKVYAATGVGKDYDAEEESECCSDDC